jgi:hypothetical protein
VSKKIVGLTGYAGSGKSSTAYILEKIAPGNFFTLHLADKLKDEAARFYNIPVDTFYSTTKKDKALSMPVEPQDEISYSICRAVGAKAYFTPRDLLVAYGAFRRFYHPEYWVEEVMGKWEGPEILLVPDIRYKNEYNILRDLGGKLVRVVKVGHERKRDDASEKEQESFHEDWTIIAQEGLEILEGKINQIDLATRIMESF